MNILIKSFIVILLTMRMLRSIWQKYLGIKTKDFFYSLETLAVDNYCYECASVVFSQIFQ